MKVWLIFCKFAQDSFDREPIIFLSLSVMKEFLDDKTDVQVNHTIGCQIVYILLGLLMAAAACFYLLKGGGNNWQRYLLAPLLAVFSVFGVYRLIKTMIKERVNKIPALTVTRNSLILSRKKEEFNEIPFDAIEKFWIQRVRTGKNRYTNYLKINYKDDGEGADGKRFELVDRIDCSGLNMRSDKLLALLRERLSKHNEQSIN
ncbi:MAG: hypothetical protein II786_01480 [Muribaculaceae bacterium]|nr:hypothetical protein [Muribaculaceae bacterium]